MSKKQLTALDGTEITIRQRKSTVVIDLVHNDPTETYYPLEFTPDGYIAAMNCIKTAAQQAWPNIKPKKYTTESSHYNNYFDQELREYGFLFIGSSNYMSITKPDKHNKRLYQFTKRKMESFLFDVQTINALNEKSVTDHAK